MAFMMTMGISLRKFSLVPIDFIAFFYTGLGASLLLAGILFLRQFFLTLTDNTKTHFFRIPLRHCGSGMRRILP